MNIAGVRMVSQTLREVAMQNALTYPVRRSLKSGMQSSLELVSSSLAQENGDCLLSTWHHVAQGKVIIL